MNQSQPPQQAQNPSIVQLIREAMDKIEKPVGATGEFPEGKLTESDKGEIRITVTADKVSGVVIVDFGPKMGWIGLNPQQARQLAESLRKRSHEAQGK